MKQFFKAPRSLLRLIHKKRAAILAGLIILGCVTVFFMQNKTTIKPAAYKPLLATIAKGESGGNYNAYFGNAGNTEVTFTAMTIAEVMNWQDEFTKKGNASNAVGKYQFMRTTLNGLVKQLRLNPHTRFSEPLQDYLAVKLIERRGAADYIEGKISRDQFAHNLSQEWAALPRVLGGTPEKSYYAGDGLNEAKISVAEIQRVLDEFKKARP